MATGLVDRPAQRFGARRERVALVRLLWVAPLTVGVALALNFAIKFAVQALDPALSRMGQLQTPLVTLTLEGAVAAVVVFAVVAWLTARPIFWYRIIAGVALLVSLLPDVALALGGASTMAAMQVVGPLLSLGSLGSAGGPPRAGGGGPPAGGIPGAPIEQVLVLMLLHVATAVVCVVLLTTLTRTRGRASAQAL